MLLLTACGSDNASDAGIASSGSSEVTSSENSSSSVSNTSSSDSIIRYTKTEVFYLSYLDTVNSRYYYADDYCLYDSASNRFSWNVSDTAGILQLDSLYHWGSKQGFGYYISKDTLYMCTGISADCTKESKNDADVFIGKFGSILGSWKQVGSITDSVYFNLDTSIYKIKRTLVATPTSFTYKYETEYSVVDLYASGDACSVLADVFGDAADKKCSGYFDRVTTHNGKYMYYNDSTDTYEDIVDTFYLADNIWMTSKGPDEVVVSVQGSFLDISLQIQTGSESLYSLTRIATYNGTACSWISKSFNVTKDVCESANPSDYQILQTTDEKGNSIEILNSDIDTRKEFKECVKQFGLFAE
jgi:hypothetical protein